MAKFLLLSGLIPVIIAFLARKFLSDGPMRKFGDEEVSLSGRELVARVLEKGGARNVEVIEKKRPFLKVGPERLLLSPALANSKRAREVAEAGILAGLVLMARKQEKVVQWRAWALKFGSAFPAFTIIAMVFALVVGRLGAGYVFGIVSASLGLSTVLLWLTLPVERTASGIVAEMVEETAIVTRRSEGEKLGTLIRALGWRRIIPGAIAWLAGK